MSEAKKVDAGGFLARVLSHPAPAANDLANQMNESELDATLVLRDECVKRANNILGQAADRREKAEVSKLKAADEKKSAAVEAAKQPHH